MEQAKWTEKFSVDEDYRGVLRYDDALVAISSVDGTHVITSPNAYWIPVPIVGVVNVVLRSDGLFGHQDPLHHPQMYCPTMPWLSALRICPSNKDDPAAIMYQTMSAADFGVTIAGSGLGLLSARFRERLRGPLYKLLARIWKYRNGMVHTTIDLERVVHYGTQAHQAFERLGRVASLTDTIRKTTCVQRYYTYLCGYLAWYIDLPNQLNSLHDPTLNLPVETRFTGAFCVQDQDVQMLQQRGIPVWFLQPSATITKRQRLVRGLSEFHQGSAHLAPMDDRPSPIYVGQAGVKHLEAIFCHAHISSDTRADLLPELLLQKQRVKSLSTNTKSSSEDQPTIGPNFITHTDYAIESTDRRPAALRGGRDKFEKFNHPWMPWPLPAWQAALERVDRGQPVPVEPWRYWLPEPALTLAPKRPDRLHRYLMNWLRIRESWLFVQGQRFSELESPALTGQQWRELLNISDSTENKAGHLNRSQKRKSDVLRILAETCEVSNVDEFLKAPVQWFGRNVSSPSDGLSRAVIWELCELGFRAELYQLDRYYDNSPPTSANSEETVQRASIREERIAAVFSDNNAFQFDHLPTAGSGLAASRIQDRLRSLEALRRIVVNWGDQRDVPDLLLRTAPLNSHMDENHLMACEEMIAKVYVNSFYLASGRAPILPHVCPVSGLDGGLP
ncbi:hypothetical protein EIP91_004521 [Steccherinum ochraceum]|uniref:Uncharacterized protein n=1 Tax=Steccherinum ochraceum TaxID=92696 RepID=A0A4R0RK00_9APHY|nr:hypothetical protein EIP91_004521 [Steccherinum ochraceum]